MTATTTALHPQRLALRFSLAARITDLEPVLAVFHRCLQRGWLEGQLIDVADYRHVPQGPGVMLVGHDIDYSLTHDTLTVTRKRSSADDAATQTRDLLRAAAVFVEALTYDGTLDAGIDTDRLPVVLLLDRALEAALVDAHGLKAVDALAEAVAPAFATAWADETPTVWGSGKMGPRGKTIPQSDAPRSLDDKDRPIWVEDPRGTLVVCADFGPGPTSPAEVVANLGGSRAPMQSPYDITVEAFAEQRTSGDVVVLDVREESEYTTVNLGGTLLPLAQLPDRLDELDRDATILVHCRAGIRGGKAVGILRDAGFADAWNVNGALVAWADRIDSSLPRY